MMQSAPDEERVRVRAAQLLARMLKPVLEGGSPKPGAFLRGDDETEDAFRLRMRGEMAELRTALKRQDEEGATSSERIVDVPDGVTGSEHPPSPSQLVIDQDGAVAEHLKHRSDALDRHERELKEEAAKSKVIHGRARHGFQTGWEGQLKRAQTRVTPDQPDDPYGTGLSETSRTWTTSEGTGMKINSKGKAVPAESPDKKVKPTKSGGPYAGAFTSPEHQNQAIDRALEQAQVFEGWDEAKFTGYTKNDGWAAIQFVEVVVADRPDGYGYSFGRNPKTGEEDPGYAELTEGTELASKGAPLFAMKAAEVQLRRTASGWEVLSSFPENQNPGAAPVQSHGEFPWTGDLRKKSGETTQMAAPDWPAVTKGD
jgi:hypothetical protein